MKATPLPGPRRPPVALVPTWRAGLSALCVALTFLVSACGPGVGGTGTGNEAQLARFGATAASVCSSELVSQLACGATSFVPGATPTSPGAGNAVSAVPDLAPGTEPVRFADAPQRVLALLQGNRIELDAPCAGMRFGGDWGTVPGQASSFYGWAESSGYTGPAVLESRLAGNGLSLRLLDAAGRVLLGPLAVARSTATQPGSCS